MKKILIMLMVVAIIGTPYITMARGGGGGGRASGGSRGGFSRPVSRPSTPSPRPVKAIVVKPEVKTSAKPVSSASGKKMAAQGTVVGDNYQPKFSGGYVAPMGATVYQQQRSFIDYLPWIFLFTQSSHREVVVETTNASGTIQQETHKEEGVDTMYIINWIVSIGLLGGLIYLVMRMFNKNDKRRVQSTRAYL